MRLVSTAIFSGINYLNEGETITKAVKKPEIKTKLKKTKSYRKRLKNLKLKKRLKNLRLKELEKSLPKVKKDEQKFEVKRKSVDEVILPNLNLKTETVIKSF